MFSTTTTTVGRCRCRRRVTKNEINAYRHSSSVETCGSTARPRHPYRYKDGNDYTPAPRLAGVDTRDCGWSPISQKTEKLESRRRAFYGTLGASGPPNAPPFCKPMSGRRLFVAQRPTIGNCCYSPKAFVRPRTSETHRAVTHSSPLLKL